MTPDLVVANLAKLPAICYAVIEGNEPGKRIIAIRRGESGCYSTGYDSPNLSIDQVNAIVDRLNARLGVTAAQREAMLSGSMFGWHTAGADADYWSQRQASRADA